MKTRYLWLGLASIIGCSSASVRVLPGENGINTVVARDRDREGAEEASLDAANDYCKKQKKSMVAINEDKTEYTGKMKESDRDAIRKASGAAMMMGAGTLGAAGYSTANDRDYKSEIKFKCQ